MMCYTEVDNDIESLVGLNIRWLEKNDVPPSLDILWLTFDLSPPSPPSCCISPTCSTPPTWQLEQLSNIVSIHQ